MASQSDHAFACEPRALVAVLRRAAQLGGAAPAPPINAVCTAQRRAQQRASTAAAPAPALRRSPSLTFHFVAWMPSWRTGARRARRCGPQGPSDGDSAAAAVCTSRVVFGDAFSAFGPRPSCSLPLPLPLSRCVCLSLSLLSFQLALRRYLWLWRFRSTYVESLRAICLAVAPFSTACLPFLRRCHSETSPSPRLQLVPENTLAAGDGWKHLAALAARPLRVPQPGPAGIEAGSLTFPASPLRPGPHHPVHAFGCAGVEKEEEGFTGCLRACGARLLWQCAFSLSCLGRRGGGLRTVKLGGLSPRASTLGGGGDAAPGQGRRAPPLGFLHAGPSSTRHKLLTVQRLNPRTQAVCCACAVCGRWRATHPAFTPRHAWRAGGQGWALEHCTAGRLRGPPHGGAAAAGVGRKARGRISPGACSHH